ncbi:MAG: hypothetical protein HZB66_00065 [Candidatus Aenigmarchaeota archaeon]|nr:hypothetical protein [Candidatus Aenigmarchaeota archaeon]
MSEKIEITIGTMSLSEYRKFGDVQEAGRHTALGLNGKGLHFYVRIHRNGSEPEVEIYTKVPRIHAYRYLEYLL